jgi:hypothetical protein
MLRLAVRENLPQLRRNFPFRLLRDRMAPGLTGLFGIDPI